MKQAPVLYTAIGLYRGKIFRDKLMWPSWQMLRVNNKCYRDYSCRKYAHSPFLKMRVL